MAPKSATPTIKTVQSLLNRIGSATSGTKDILISRLSQDLQRPRLPIQAQAMKKTAKTFRILSIDMGIKNLAYCVTDVQIKDVPRNRTTTEKPTSGVQMKIDTWRRLDVAEEMSRIANTSDPLLRPSILEAAQRYDEEVEDPYTPSALSQTALALVRRTFLSCSPDIILIERQRWRSAGGPSIQQWTVRVNTLEGMFWAILAAFRSPPGPYGTIWSQYRVFGVDPKRVGNFWLAKDIGAQESGEDKKRKKRGVVEDELNLGPEGEVQEVITDSKTTVKKMGRVKAEKKAKIQLVRSWLTQSPQHTTLSTSQETTGEGAAIHHSPPIEFTFSSQAEETRGVLCATENRKRGGTSKAERSKDLKKMDDVTDCFLQAAAWVAWEVNKLNIRHDEWDSDMGRLLFDTIEGSQSTQVKKNKKKTSAPTETGETGNDPDG